MEAGAIHRVFTADRERSSPLYLGSIKTNIGHLEGASGLAGVIKAVLCLEKGQIPPNINFEKPNALQDIFCNQSRALGGRERYNRFY